MRRERTVVIPAAREVRRGVRPPFLLTLRKTINKKLYPSVLILMKRKERVRKHHALCATVEKARPCRPRDSRRGATPPSRLRSH